MQKVAGNRNFIEFIIIFFVILKNVQRSTTMTENQKDIELLNTNPGEIVVKYQDLVSTVIQFKLINAGFYPTGEKDELIQEASIRLLGRMDAIKKQYKEISMLKTFVSVVIKNICYGILREKKRQPIHMPLEDNMNNIPPGKDNSIFNLVLEDDFKKFEAILKMYYRKRPKIEISVQLIYRIPVILIYFINYCKKTAKAFCKAVKDLLPINKNFTHKEIYHIITPYFNKCDDKNNTGSSTQRWMNNIINQSIKLMNTGHEPDVYDKEIFQVLVEKYYQFKK